MKWLWPLAIAAIGYCHKASPDLNPAVFVSTTAQQAVARPRVLHNNDLFRSAGRPLYDSLSSETCHGPRTLEPMDSPFWRETARQRDIKPRSIALSWPRCCPTSQGSKKSSESFFKLKTMRGTAAVAQMLRMRSWTL